MLHNGNYFKKGNYKTLILSITWLWNFSGIKYNGKRGTNALAGEKYRGCIAIDF
jgi:hypothetical protein